MDTTTALALILPEEFHSKVNEIRSLHDKAFVRWIPHINFIFPFVPISQFDDLIGKLQPEFDNFDSFDLELNDIGFFPQRGAITVHIKPKDDSKLQELYKLIQKNVTIKPKKGDFWYPHLTIGQFRELDLNQSDTKIKELKNG